MFKTTTLQLGKLKKVISRNKIKYLKKSRILPDEMTPNLFNHHNMNSDYVKIIHIPTMLERSKKLPKVPIVDYRKLKNKYWLKDYDRHIVTYKCFRLLKLRDDIYKGTVNIHEFGKEFKTLLKLNLSVFYGEDYYDSPLLGNYLEIPQTQKQPRVFYPTDGMGEGEKYTLIMFTPGNYSK